MKKIRYKSHVIAIYSTGYQIFLKDYGIVAEWDTDPEDAVTFSELQTLAEEKVDWLIIHKPELYGQLKLKL